MGLHAPAAGAGPRPDDEQAQVARVEAAIEAQAPGSAPRPAAARAEPTELERADRNLDGGALGGGSAGIYQELFFRPIPGLGRAETVIDGLYLASSSAHPGGGVHGAPGSNAALAALRRAGPVGRAHRAAVDAAFRRVYRS